MGVRISDNNKIPKLMKQMKGYKGKTIEVGYFGDGEVAKIAGVHEFGAEIPVTDKMRAYLHYIGIHLKKDTTKIRIPERSFLRSGFDENINDLMQKVEMLLEDAVNLRIDSDTFLEAIGMDLQGAIQDYVDELDSPANANVTKERKGSSNPLIDTGHMRDSIDYRVK